MSIAFAAAEDAMHDNVLAFGETMGGMIGEGPGGMMLVDVFRYNILGREVYSTDKVAFIDDGGSKIRMVETANGKETSRVWRRYVEVTNTKRSSIRVFDSRKQADGTWIVSVKRSIIMEKVAVSGDGGESSSVNLSTCNG